MSLEPKLVLSFMKNSTSPYDHVHSGSTHFFIDPDRTEADFHRAESSHSREEGRVDFKKLLEAGGYLC